MRASRSNVRRNSEIFALCCALPLIAATAEELQPTDPTLKALLKAGIEASNGHDWQKQDNTLPRPHAVLIPAFLAYADLKKGGDDAIIALDWVVEHVSHAEPDAVKAAAILRSVTERLEKIDVANKTVRESIAFAEYMRGHLLYLDEGAIGFRSHDAAHSTITDEMRIAAALESFRYAAKINPEGVNGTRAAEFVPEILHQRPGTKASDLIGSDAKEKPIRVADFKGKVIILKFWGTWYGTMGDQFDSEREALRKFRDRGVVVLLGETQGIGGGVTVSTLTDPDAKVTSAERPAQALSPQTEWSVRGLPQTYVIDKNGIVRFASFRQNNDEIVEAVRRLVDAKP